MAKIEDIAPNPATLSPGDFHIVPMALVVCCAPICKQKHTPARKTGVCFCLLSFYVIFRNSIRYTISSATLLF